MTQEHGINPENREGDKTFLLLQKGNSLQLVADFTISGNREIYGVAHVPTIDRENELILAEAIRKALPHYMELPILHVQHTERPIGTVTKALVDDEGKLHLYGKIKETSDTDDVWEDIRNGTLNKFSIFGKRMNGSPECALSPNQRMSPCVTKALQLFSISVVGDNAMNQSTFLEVAKAFGSDEMEEEDKKDEEVEKCSGIKKEDDSGLIREPSNVSSIMERIEGIEKSVAALYDMANPVEKSEEKEEGDSMEEEKKKEETVEKAASVVEEGKKVDESDTTVTPPEFVVKAELSQYITKAEFETISKAFDDLKTRIDKMEKETIEKGGNVVIIKADDLKDNPNMGNLEAIGA